MVDSGTLIILPYEKSPANFLEVRRICRDFEYLNSYLDFFKDPYFRTFFILMNKIKAGLMVLSRHSMVLYGDFLWIDPDFRNKGLGSYLLSYAEKMAKEEKLIALCGDSISTDVGAHRLYERIGANKYGVYDNFYGNGTEFIFMFRKNFPEICKE